MSVASRRSLWMWLLLAPILRGGNRVYISNVFWVPVEIEGSKAVHERLVLDTGSPFTWIYNYKILKEAHGTMVGGYGTTALQTLVTAPRGGNVIIYADNDRIECDKWTEREFTLHSRKWDEPFGIANYAIQRAKRPAYTGLLGVSRDSNFIRSVDVFGFKPSSRHEAEMFYTPIQRDWCRNNSLVYYPLSKGHREFERHWASDTIVTFGEIRYKTGFILDTGASVIALPTAAFRDFTNALWVRGIRFQYYPDKLQGVIPCSAVPEMPSWYIGDKDTEGHFRVTPSMYVVEDSGDELCAVDVARVSTGHPIIFGLPVLRHAVSEFNNKNKSIGLCANKDTDMHEITRTARMSPDYYPRWTHVGNHRSSVVRTVSALENFAIVSVLSFLIFV